MSDVTKLHLVPIDRTGRPQVDVICYLESVLARAKIGEIQSVVVIYASADGIPGHGAAYGETANDANQIARAMMLAEHALICASEEASIDIESSDPPA